MWAKLGVPPPPLTNTAVALSEGDEETDPPGPEESSPGGRRLDVIEVPNRNSDSDILRDDESRGGVGLKKIGHLCDDHDSGHVQHGLNRLQCRQKPVTETHRPRIATPKRGRHGPHASNVASESVRAFDSEGFAGVASRSYGGKLFSSFREELQLVAAS